MSESPPSIKHIAGMLCKDIANTAQAECSEAWQSRSHVVILRNVFVHDVCHSEERLTNAT